MDSAGMRGEVAPSGPPTACARMHRPAAAAAPTLDKSSISTSKHRLNDGVFFVLFTQLSLIDISETTHYTVVKRRADNFTHWVGVVKGCYGSSLVFCGVISQVVGFHIDYTGNTAVRGSQSDSQYPRRGLTTYWAFTWSINRWYNTSIE